MLQKGIIFLKEQWNRLPHPMRWMVVFLGVLTACVIGGAVTAYGGLLLLLLMFAAGETGLWYLLDYAGCTAIGEESGWRDKRFRRVFLGMALAGLIVTAGLIFYRQTVYVDDHINYWAKQDLLISVFGSNGFAGCRLLAENILTADYKMFCSLFITGFYLPTTRTIQAFILAEYLGCVVPALYGLLLVCQKLALAAGRSADGWYLSACAGIIVLWPMLLHPVTHGMPDCFGLAFVAVLALLCWDYRFRSLPLGRLLALFAATLCLILTRRWYMFWVVAFWGCFVLLSLGLAVREKALGLTLRNMVLFGVPSVVGIVGPLFLTFKTILSTDYAAVYGAYYGGGILENLRIFWNWQGAAAVLLAGAGAVVLILRKKTRWQAVCLLGASAVSFVLFARTQSFGYHQALLLAPFFVWCWAGALTACRRKGCHAVALIWAVFSFAVSLGLMPDTILTGNIPADLSRRTDLAAIQMVDSFVAENCGPGEFAYVNSVEYPGNVFRYSGEMELREKVVWESSIPSTHGFSTDLWEAKYAIVDQGDGSGSLLDTICTAFQGETPVTAHFQPVTTFDMGDTVLVCYKRIAPVDGAEYVYLLELLSRYDQDWPELFSQRMNEYMTDKGVE